MKSKGSSKQAHRSATPEEGHRRGGAFSYIKSRLFHSGDDNHHQQHQHQHSLLDPDDILPRASSSSSRAKTIASSQNDDACYAQSYDGRSDDTTPCTRPKSVLALSTGSGRDDNSSVHRLLRRRPTPHNDKKRTSFTVTKEGYLYKKADFRVFHKTSKRDRSWKPYRVVLRGHKLYLYKVSSDTAWQAMFPTSPSAASSDLPASLSSISLASSSINQSPLPLQSESADEPPSPLTDTDPPPPATLLYRCPPLVTTTADDTEAAAADKDGEFVLGAIVSEIGRRQALLIFSNSVTMCTPVESNGWEIDCRMPIHDVQLMSTEPAVVTLGYRGEKRTFSFTSDEIGKAWQDAFSEQQTQMHKALEEAARRSYYGGEKHPGLAISTRSHHVKAGSVTALIHELLFQTQTEDDFLDAFLLTYSMFTTATRVLEVLNSYASHVVEDFDRIAARFLDICMRWCTQFGSDVVGEVATGIIALLDKVQTSQDEVLRQRARHTKDVVIVTVENNGQQASSVSIRDEITEFRQDIPGVGSDNQSGTGRVDLSNLVLTGLTPSLLLSIDPAGFAEQVYLFHYVLHKQFKDALLSPLSYVPNARGSPQILNSLLATTASPHFLTKLIRHQILVDSQQEELDKTENGALLRAHLLEHWGHIGQALFRLGDMVGWCAVASGICSLGVSRLKESWKSVDRNLITVIMREWVPLLTSHGLFPQDVWMDRWEERGATEQYARVFDRVHSDLPSLPYFGPIKQGVDRLRKHVATFRSEGLVNFDRSWSVLDLVYHGLENWNPTLTEPAPFEAVGPLQDFFESSVTAVKAVPHDFKYLQECSLACEPRVIGQSFDRHRRVNMQTDVAPPSASTLTFPEVLEAYCLFPGDDLALHSVKAAVHDEPPRTPHSLVQTRSPRVTGRKMFRRRTYSFPPGGAGPELEKPKNENDQYLDTMHSKTWLGSLISSKQGTYTAKALLDSMQGRSLDAWLVTTDDLALKASTLLQSDDSVTLPRNVKKSMSSGFLALTEKGSSGMRSRSGTLSNATLTGIEGLLSQMEEEQQQVKSDKPSSLLVNVKAATLERLVDVLVHGVSQYSGEMQDQWQYFQKEDMPQQLTIDEEEYLNVFFVTYRSFCSCLQLLDLLRSKFVGAKEAARVSTAKVSALESVFQAPKLSTALSEDDTLYDWKAVAQTQLRVLNLMFYWMDEHFYDFLDEIEIIRFVEKSLKLAQDALDEWRLPLQRVKQPTTDIQTALAMADQIDKQMQGIRTLMVRNALSPCYDLKAIQYDTVCSRQVDELYRHLTGGAQGFCATIESGTNKPLTFSLDLHPRDPSHQPAQRRRGLVDSIPGPTLLAQVDRCVRPLFASVTLQDWIQTFDVFEAQSSDLYSWLPSHKPPQTPPMSSALSPVLGAPSAQQTSYTVPTEDVVVSDIFTAIEGARRSIVSPCAFSADDLLLAFPSSIQYLYSMHFTIRSWVIREIASQEIDLQMRMQRIDKFVCMVAASKVASEQMVLFPELKDVEDRPRRVPGFVEYAIASALISPEVRLFSKAWTGVAKRYGLAQLDTFECLLAHVAKSGKAMLIHDMVLVPSIGWIFDRMLELCAVPDLYQDKWINFDKRRYIFHFLQLVMNSQVDLEEESDGQNQNTIEFVIAPDPHKATWKELKEFASVENKSASLVRGAPSARTAVFPKLVSEQLDKLKRDIKERNRIDKECLELQHKLQKRQLEQVKHQEKQQQQQQDSKKKHHLPKIPSILRSLRPHSMLLDHEIIPFATAKASTVINLIHATTSIASAYTKRDHVFRVVTEEGGQYLFQGMNREDMYAWMQEINNAAREGAAKRQSVLAAEAQNDSLRTADDVASLASAHTGRKSVYGVDLNLLMGDGSVPLIVEKCIREIERRGLEEVGIYRVPGMGSTVNQLKAAFNKDMASVDLSDPDWADINVVADALKQFLRDLPGSLMTHTYYDEFVHASASEDHDQRVYLIKQVLKKLPQANYILLRRLVEHFVIVTDFEAINHMYATNLAIVFGPTLLKPAPGPASCATTISNLGHQQNIVKYLILHYHYLFDIEGEEVTEE
ncbi:hypothetical protein BCR43DRAFT_484703 [Syncephalastrum racemosum]|uniref:Rho GTPase activation protein n=1 Tax=Syncephalastrum racemosum TaxID=13706 RepID=A0A1X2HL74_SYNRA|nr:hypothetical protein BCR43DRAFT_484703 [Syncephalastrum racemosum]